ncbi:MAG: hypothetical protein PWQ82_560 [Thermosediminibacterales bacterium]|nr:hypothetical protein [Thermosediminibacterales bacterium]MDK2835486.1 hypothetical protein [Thermosediminibacterales bacterium]
MDRPAAENRGVDERLFNKIIEINKKTPFHRHMNMNITMLGKGIARLELKIDKYHTNPMGIAHGGVAFSLLDTAMGMAVRTLGFQVTTVEMNINYTAPGIVGDIMIAEGRVVNLGRKIIVAEGEIVNKEGRLLAKSRETFFNLGQIDIK